MVTLTIIQEMTKSPNLLKTKLDLQTTNCEEIDDLPFVASGNTMRGLRDEQEDGHNMLIPCERKDNSMTSCFAIYDGHAGDFAAKYLQNQFLFSIFPNDNEILENDQLLQQEFLKFDEELLKNPQIGDSGSTAILVFLKQNFEEEPQKLKLICANVGDSRAIFHDCGTILELSEDHKASLRRERKRIYAASHFIQNDRIDGSLQPTRTFGDIEFKQNNKLPFHQQAVISKPEIKTETIDLQSVNEDSNFKFLILGCDGVWDVISNKEISDFVCQKLTEFDIFNPNFKVHKNYFEKHILEAAKLKGDDWIWTPIENWSKLQFKRWFDSIPIRSLHVNQKKISNINELTEYIEQKLKKNEDFLQKSDFEDIQMIEGSITQIKTFSEKRKQDLETGPYLSTIQEKLEKINEILMDEIVIHRESDDNVTLMIVLFKNDDKISIFNPIGGVLEPTI